MGEGAFVTQNDLHGGISVFTTVINRERMVKFLQYFVSISCMVPSTCLSRKVLFFFYNLPITFTYFLPVLQTVVLSEKTGAVKIEAKVSGYKEVALYAIGIYEDSKVLDMSTPARTLAS